MSENKKDTCPRCGKQLESNSAFCNGCGLAIQKNNVNTYNAQENTNDRKRKHKDRECCCNGPDCCDCCSDGCCCHCDCDICDCMTCDCCDCI